MISDNPDALTGQGGSKRDLRVGLLAICIVGILSVGAVLQIFSISEATAGYKVMLDRSIEHRSSIRRIDIRVGDAEAALLRYLISRQDEHLIAFYKGKQAVEQELQLLGSLMRAGEHGYFGSGHFNVAVLARLERLSEEAEKITYSDPARLPGEAEAAALLRTDSSTESLIDFMTKAESSQIRRISASVDRQLLWAQNTTIFLMCTILVLVVASALAVLAYLSRRNVVEQQLVEARRMAEDANKAKSDFLATMSHEIRTPLTSIIGYSDLLGEGKLTPVQRNFVQRLRASSATLLALVNDVLDFSKVEAGQISVERAPFSLPLLIEEILSAEAVGARKKGILLVQSIERPVPAFVVGDEQKLRQVLLNLLNNAVKFTSAGSVTLRIAFASEGQNERLRFEIVDTGIGIPDDKQERLFQKFTQADSSIQREYGGTGLGLAISRSMVQLMGGQIGVESRQGKGSKFWVELPLPEALDTPGVEEAPRISGHSESHSAGGRILLVEDSPQNQDLVTAILTAAGYHVQVANDGWEAIEAMESGQHDLVLMDMQMPRMDGLQATRRIRRMVGPAAVVPIIAMTANVLTEHLSEFRAAGTDAHVSKPFKREVLLQTIRHALTTRKGAGAAPAQIAREQPVHDAAALEDIRALMGDEWILACLSRLRSLVVRLFDDGPVTEAEAASLRRIAHQTVSDAGQLGFIQLSSSCSALEQACVHGRDIPDALERASRAARNAEIRFAELARSLGRTKPATMRDKAAQPGVVMKGRHLRAAG